MQTDPYPPYLGVALPLRPAGPRHRGRAPRPRPQGPPGPVRVHPPPLLQPGRRPPQHPGRPGRRRHRGGDRGRRAARGLGVGPPERRAHGPLPHHRAALHPDPAHRHDGAGRPALPVVPAARERAVPPARRRCQPPGLGAHPGRQHQHLRGLAHRRRHRAPGPGAPHRRPGPLGVDHPRGCPVRGGPSRRQPLPLVRPSRAPPPGRSRPARPGAQHRGPRSGPDPDGAGRGRLHRRWLRHPDPGVPDGHPRPHAGAPASWSSSSPTASSHPAGPAASDARLLSFTLDEPA